MSGWSVTADALLIDLDGTLVDSHDAIERAWDRWADNQHVDRAAVLELMPGRTATSVIGELKPELPADLVARQADELMRWQVADTGGVVAAAGARSLLARIPPERWAVVTACSDRLARARLRAAGLPVPDVLVGCDLAAASKPDPSGYLLAARLLRAEPDRCLVIEDSLAGCAAGRAAGAKVLAVGAAANGGCDGDGVHPGSLEQLRLERGPGDGALRISEIG